ncbi:hypothetical protein [Ekhidna sp.]
MPATELDLEDRFKKMIKECKEFKYTPKTFIKMLSQLGAVEAAERLINQEYTSEGFLRLSEEKRLDLTIEAIVYDNEEYHHLFSKDIIDRAKQKLKSIKYLR